MPCMIISQNFQPACVSLEGHLAESFRLPLCPESFEPALDVPKPGAGEIVFGRGGSVPDDPRTEPEGRSEVVVDFGAMTGLGDDVSEVVALPPMRRSGLASPPPDAGAGLVPRPGKSSFGIVVPGEVAVPGEVVPPPKDGLLPPGRLGVVPEVILGVVFPGVVLPGRVGGVPGLVTRSRA